MEKLPAPRLQLRWEASTAAVSFGRADWACHYELVLPLREYDQRREIYDNDGELIEEREEHVVPIRGPTLRGSTSTPCYGGDGTFHADAPIRDGAHAQWDSVALGGLPIYVIAPDGKAIQLEIRVDD